MEKNVRLNAAEKEEAWKGIGKKEGTDIWRIEKFKVVPWPADRFGEFYSGDSYIVLHTYKKPDDKKFSYDVHFWLGRETSQDEAGTAAYKTVELDDYLGGAPVQHREVQGHESELFMSYFPKFKAQEGGVESGFKHVKPEEYRPRLLHVKGIKNRIAVSEVERSYKSMNSGDCFVLDAGLKIYTFSGKSASVMERNKAKEFAQSLASDRKTAKVSVHLEGDSDLSEFWQALGGEGPIKSATEGGDDAAAAAAGTKRLFRLSDSTGKMSFKEEASGKVRKVMFDSNDVFIFDTGAEVFVWVGKKASSSEKRMALQSAQNYLVEYKRPVWLPISRVIEGAENEVFNSALDAPESKIIIQKKNGEAKDAAAPVPAAQKK